MGADASRKRYLLRRAVRKVVRPLRRLMTLGSAGEPGDLLGEKPFGPWEAWEAQHILAVIAHPDDEVFCSGLLAGAAALGAKVSILCMTRGEGGDCHRPRSKRR